MKGLVNSLDSTLTELYAKAPALPKEAKKFIVSIMPWAALIFGLMGVPALLAVFGIGILATPWMVMAGGGTVLYWLTWLAGGVSVVLNLMAVKPLMSQKISGWRLIFYSSLVNAVSLLLGFNIVGLVGVFLGWYILYQIKPQYSKV